MQVDKEEKVVCLQECIPVEQEPMREIEVICMDYNVVYHLINITKR